MVPKIFDYFNTLLGRNLQGGKIKVDNALGESKTNNVNIWKINDLEIDKTSKNTSLLEQIVAMDPIDLKCTIGSLLTNAYNILEEMHAVILKNNCAIIASPTDTQEQTFLYKDKCYILSDPLLLEELQHILTGIKSDTTYDKIISRRQTKLLNSLQDVIAQDLSEIKNPIIADYANMLGIGSVTVAKLIINVLNTFLRKKLMKKQHDFKFLQQSVGTALGNVLYEAAMASKYLYFDITEFNNEFNVIKDKNDIQEFRTRTSEQLIQLLKALKDKTLHETLEKDHEFYFKDSELLPEIIMSLELHCMVNDLIPVDLATKNAIQILLNKSYLDLGMEVIYYLEKIKVIKLERDNKKVPYLRIEGNYELECFTSASYFKPLLSKNVTSRTESFNSAEQFKILIKNSTKAIPNKKYIHISPEKKLYELLNSYDDAPYKTNKKGLQGLIDLLEIFMAEDNYDNINLFMNPIFDMQIELAQKNTKNSHLVQQLIHYAQNFKRMFSEEHKKIFKDNLSCNDKFNKINSYKFMIGQILTDAFVLSHFKRYYIPHYVTASGRLLSKVNMLQLQGLKVVKALTCFETATFIRESDLQEINSIIKELLPEISPELLYKDVASLTKALRQLYNIYVASFCIENTDISTFPSEESLYMQYKWLSHHAKKVEHILYLRTLILCSDEFLQMFYYKDATSSGLQLIAFLLKDLVLAKRTGLLAESTKDVHTQVKDNVILLQDKVSTHVIMFFKEILELNLYENTILELRKKKKKVPLTEHIKKLIMLPFHRDESLENDSRGITKKEKTIANKCTIEKIKDSSESKDTILFRKELHRIEKDLARNSALETKIALYKLPMIAGETTLCKIPKFTNPAHVTLYLLRKLYNTYKVFNSLPSDFLTRKFFKNLGMPLSYGEGSSSRMNRIIESITEYASEQGYDESIMSRSDAIESAIVINHYFMIASEEIFASVEKFIEITQGYVDSKEFVKINMEYYTWELLIRETNSSRHRVRMNDNIKEDVNFTIYHTYAVNTDQIKVKFPAILTQSVEARVVYKVIEYVSTLNKQFRAKNLPEIYLTINHDNFGINMIYAYLLIPLVAKAYNSINELNLNILGLQSPSKPPITVTGKKFITH